MKTQEPNENEYNIVMKNIGFKLEDIKSVPFSHADSSLDSELVSCLLSILDDCKEGIDKCKQDLLKSIMPKDREIRKK